MRERVLYGSFVFNNPAKHSIQRGRNREHPQFRRKEVYPINPPLVQFLRRDFTFTPAKIKRRPGTRSVISLGLVARERNGLVETLRPGDQCADAPGTGPRIQPSKGCARRCPLASTAVRMRCRRAAEVPWQ